MFPIFLLKCLVRVLLRFLLGHLWLSLCLYCPGTSTTGFCLVVSPQQNFLDNLVEAVARDRLVGRCGDLEKVGSGWFLILCSDIFKVGRPEVPRVMGGGFRARLLSHSLLSVVAQPFSELK